MPLELTAYIVSSTDNWTLQPAPATRDWMDATPQKFAYRCLPLSMANQSGWVVGCPITFSATWNGGSQIQDIAFSFTDKDLGPNIGQIRSHFGSGIVTFSLPWLFRTSPGYGLVVRGPTNSPKDGVVPLDGLVETDWAPFTFTMNWKIQRRREQIWFKKGEPICMIQPVDLGLVERTTPRIAPIQENKELYEQYQAFIHSRTQGLVDLFHKGTPFWEKHYMKGTGPEGEKTTEHRSRYTLLPFTPRPPARE